MILFSREGIHTRWWYILHHGPDRIETGRRKRAKRRYGTAHDRRVAPTMDKLFPFLCNIILYIAATAVRGRGEWWCGWPQSAQEKKNYKERTISATHRTPAAETIGARAQCCQRVQKFDRWCTRGEECHGRCRCAREERLQPMVAVAVAAGAAAAVAAVASAATAVVVAAAASGPCACARPTVGRNGLHRGYSTHGRRVNRVPTGTCGHRTTTRQWRVASREGHHVWEFGFSHPAAVCPSVGEGVRGVGSPPGRFDHANVHFPRMYVYCNCAMETVNFQQTFEKTTRVRRVYRRISRST